MILEALKYVRYKGEPREWKITGKDSRADSFVEFSNINFLVGKNASGKSRSLTAIKEIAEYVGGKRSIEDSTFEDESFEVRFTDGADKYAYTLAYRDRVIESETLIVNGKEALNRETKKIMDLDKGAVIPFPEDASSPLIFRLGETGISYFSKLVLWGSSLRNYNFTNELEKSTFVPDYKQMSPHPSYSKYTMSLVYIFNKGYEDFGEAYINEIKEHMFHIGYENITDILIRESKKGFGLYIEEDGKYCVSQQQMSQGLFRALGLFIRLTYYVMSKTSVCVLVDDIGEGIDFDRSRTMINIITKRINSSNIQLFITTNNRYVMNQIPLRYWNVIERKQSMSIFHNYFNSKEIFEDFKYTGLNNFDFLATDFYKKGFNELED